MKTYKKLRKILKEIQLKEDGVAAIGGGGPTNVTGAAIAGTTPDTVLKKQILFNTRRKKPKSEK